MSVSEKPRPSDAEIVALVEDELRWTPNADADRITVGVENGVVTLTGEVDHLMSRHVAAKAALRVRGVRGVANEIAVSVTNGDIPDPLIADAVAHAVEWTSGIAPGDVHVEVQDGAVTLNGTVEWDSVRVSLEQDIRGIRGVRSLEDRITLSPRVSSPATHARITDALKRNALTDAKSIDVTVQGTVVVLSGRVGSWDEKRQAELAAWASPHVSAVKNHLQVYVR
ncbi:BON domain-containing protein [Humibacter sp. BT305]|nr:BON domain-containing protein [Humibacter sp. BT305]